MGKKKKKKAKEVKEVKEEGEEEGEEYAQREVEGVEVEGEQLEKEGKAQETRGQLIQRHKRELKELKKKTQSLEHSVPKGDKKAKREVQEEIKKLEETLRDTQLRELQDFDQRANNTEVVVAVKEVETKQQSTEEIVEKEVTTVKQTEKMSKAKRRKAALVAKEKERERQILEEKKNVVSQRDLENRALLKALIPLNLTIKQITPDGNCMYNSIADQLQLLGEQQQNYQVLRQLAADFIRQHAEEFMPFIDVDDGEVTEDKFEDYCNTVANTTAWGGQLELKALVHALQHPIIIHTADQHSSTIEMGTEYSLPALHLSYHRFYYSLGEHYNSVVPLKKNGVDDESEEEEEGYESTESG